MPFTSGPDMTGPAPAVALRPLSRAFVGGRFRSQSSARATGTTVLSRGARNSERVWLRALRSGFSQLVRNEVPIYEIISGAAIAFAAFLLILPGFATDFLGFLLIFPFTRKLIIGRFAKKSGTYKKTKKDFIEGQYEDIDEDLK